MNIAIVTGTGSGMCRKFVKQLPGFAQVFLAGLLPHRFVMKTWIAQQKKPKNNQNLTTK